MSKKLNEEIQKLKKIRISNNKEKIKSLYNDTDSISKIKSLLGTNHKKVSYKPLILVLVILIFVLAISFQINKEVRKKEDFYKNLPPLFNKDGSLYSQKKFSLSTDLKLSFPSYFMYIDKQYPSGLHNAIERQKNASQNLPLEIKNSLGMAFRLIPRGQFLMGSPKSELGHEKTEFLHPQKIPYNFYVAKFEVKQSEWQKIMGYNNSSQKNPSFPIVDITKKEIDQFIVKLNKYLGVPANTYQLLTEKEWEYTCRAGAQTAYNFVIEHFADYYLHYKANAGKLLPIGEKIEKKYQKIPNAWGIYNMHGSVGELTQSYFTVYQLGENHFHPTWDKKIYDGDVPEDKKNPLDNFKVQFRENGSIPKKLFFIDENNDKKWSNNELIWQDKAGGQSSVYDHGKDLIVFQGTGLEKILKFWDKRVGIKGNLLFKDKNGNKIWDKGEEIWEKNLQLRKKFPKTIFRGGSWINNLIDCRSATRWNWDEGAYDSAYVGIRLKRNLYGIKKAD